MLKTMRIFKSGNQVFKGYSVWLYGEHNRLGFVAVTAGNKGFSFMSRKHGGTVTKQTLPEVKEYLINNAELYL